MTVVDFDSFAARVHIGELDVSPAKSRNGARNIGVPIEEEGATREIRLTPASTIQMKSVHWLWKSRIPLGELTLLAGREGIGKSTIAFQIAAWLTRGELDGWFYGSPKNVIIAATEDSWEHTIVPRLTGAGADLDKVFRVDVIVDESRHGTLTLPRDVDELRKLAR